jgi:hypothetical protein
MKFPMTYSALLEFPAQNQGRALRATTERAIARAKLSHHRASVRSDSLAEGSGFEPPVPVRGMLPLMSAGAFPAIAGSEAGRSFY